MTAEVRRNRPEGHCERRKESVWYLFEPRKETQVIAVILSFDD